MVGNEESYKHLKLEVKIVENTEQIQCVALPMKRLTTAVFYLLSFIGSKLFCDEQIRKKLSPHKQRLKWAGQE